MPAITLQVMVNAPTHVIDTSFVANKAAMRRRNGDILAVHNTQNFATLNGNDWNWNEPISSPRSVFIHIRDIPANLVPLARQRLTGKVKAASERIRIRQYRIPPGIMPQPVIDALQADREVTMDWTQAKTIIKKKSVTVVLDPDQDDESTSVVDADLL